MIYLGMTGIPGCFGARKFASGEPGSLASHLSELGASAVDIMLEGPAWGTGGGVDSLEVATLESPRLARRPALAFEGQANLP